MVPVPPEFYALLEDMRKTVSQGIERVDTKLDDVRNNMATHREVDELKQRLAKTEAILDLVRDESVKRPEVMSILQDLRSSMRSEIDGLKKTNEQLQESYVQLQSRQGKLPGWLWAAVISGVFTFADHLFKR